LKKYIALDNSRGIKMAKVGCVLEPQNISKSFHDVG
jgi:hypothetical protein